MLFSVLLFRREPLDLPWGHGRWPTWRRGLVCLLFSSLPDVDSNFPVPRKDPARLRCNKCSKEILTRVCSRISKKGICWGFICCFCGLLCIGSCILSLLVLCMDSFKVVLHFCPECNELIGIYKTGFSKGTIFKLILFTIFIIALQMFLVIYVLIPALMWHQSQGKGS